MPLDRPSPDLAGNSDFLRSNFVDDSGLYEKPVEDGTSHMDYEEARNHEIESFAARMKMSVAEVQEFLDFEIRLEMIPKGPSIRRMMLKQLRKNGTAPARWMMLHGISPDLAYEWIDRRKRLRYLHNLVVLLVRRAFVRVAGGKDESTSAERSVYWEPVSEICLDLEISQSKLSGFLKEFNGLNLKETVDSVRVEVARKMIRAELREVVLAWKSTHGATFSDESGHRSKAAWAVFGAVKKGRKESGLNASALALKLGFATSVRLNKACIAVYRKTLLQLQFEMISELLGDSEAADVVVEVSVEEVQTRLTGLVPFDVLMMRAKAGPSEELQKAG